MSIVSEILQELWDTTINCHGLPVNLFGIPRFKKYSPTSFRSTVSKLKRKNLIRNDSEGWYITKSGGKYFQKDFSFKKIKSPFGKSAPKNLIVMFDVPEEKRQHRDWLRRQLRDFNYVMIQKSVWVGPSPLPKEFTYYTKEIKITNSIKTFKLAKGYSQNK